MKKFIFILLMLPMLVYPQLQIGTSGIVVGTTTAAVESMKVTTNMGQQVATTQYGSNIQLTQGILQNFWNLLVKIEVVDEESNESNTSVYPNLTKNYVKIVSISAIKSVIVIDMKGNIIMSYDNFQEDIIDLTDEESGMYIIRIFDGNGKFENFKIVKQ